MDTFESKIVKNSVVRVKIYYQRMPEHWDSKMLDLCGKVYTVSEIYPRDPYDTRPLTLNRMDTIMLKEDKTGWWFYRDDFEKVNTNPKRKSKK
jgi:hypothetical protein